MSEKNIFKPEETSTIIKNLSNAIEVAEQNKKTAVQAMETALSPGMSSGVVKRVFNQYMTDMENTSSIINQIKDKLESITQNVRHYCNDMEISGFNC